MKIGFRVLAALAIGPVLTAQADEIDDAVEAAMRFMHEGNSTAAIEVLTPHHSADEWAVCFWLGSAHLSLGNLDLARAYLDDALLRGGDVADVWIQRAVVAQEAGRPEVAVELLLIAATLDEWHPLVHLNMGYAFEQLGRRNEAIAAYRSYLQLAARARPNALLSAEIMERIVRLADGSKGREATSLESDAATARTPQQ